MAAARRRSMAIACWTTILAAVAVAAMPHIRADETPGALRPFANPTGTVRTSTTSRIFDGDNPFFLDLGTNGRRCVSCHQASDAWTITPAHVQARFDESNGGDPIFTSNDGSNCEGAQPHSTADMRAAYSLLLTRGLIRIGLDVPPDAEFVIDAVDDPYHCAPGTNDLSAYRRPLPSTNLRFLTAVMWDGRESLPTRTILEDLAHQANSATLGHAQAARDLTAHEAQDIVAFETGLFTAQDRDRFAGSLRADGARGGPAALSGQPFFPGINDPVGLNPTGAPFDPNVFTIFNAWKALGDDDDPTTAARRAIARGQNTFNTRTFTISGVAGLNNQTFPNGVTVPPSLTGTCTICHDTPNAGDHSVKAPLNIGVADPARAPYLPKYRLRNIQTGDAVWTTDPGRAMSTGRWADIGKFKGPILRALAARPPYFHNGSARTLEEVVEFYDTRFNMGLTMQEKADLVAFLRAL
jgi:cytochrome c peroxidase